MSFLSERLPLESRCQLQLHRYVGSAQREIAGIEQLPHPVGQPFVQHHQCLHIESIASVRDTPSYCKTARNSMGYNELGRGVPVPAICFGADHPRENAGDNQSDAAGNFGDLFMDPSFQVLEPLQNTGRFNLCRRGHVVLTPAPI